MEILIVAFIVAVAIFMMVHYMRGSFKEGNRCHNCRGDSPGCTTGDRGGKKKQLPYTCAEGAVGSGIRNA